MFGCVNLRVKDCFADAISKASQWKWRVPQKSSNDSWYCSLSGKNIQPWSDPSSCLCTWACIYCLSRITCSLHHGWIIYSLFSSVNLSCSVSPMVNGRW